MSSFAERLEEARKEKGFTQKAISEQIGITDAYMSQMSTGKRMPSDRTAKDLAEALGVNVQWLLEGPGPKRPDLSREEEMSEIISRVLSQKDNSFVKQAIKTLTSLTYEEMQVLEKVVNSLAKKKD